MYIRVPFSSIEVEINRHKRLSSSQPISEQKVFVIGLNKTGTTTLKDTLNKLGYKIGDQRVAEILAIEWAETGDPRKIINYCYTAEAFQDLPFSKPRLYRDLHKSFPSSKFILTHRNNAEQWFNSLVKFHSKRFSSKPGHPPSERDLFNACYRYKGFMLDVFKLFYNFPSTPLYHKESYTSIYNNHINEVRAYFKDKPGKLLEINVAKKSDFTSLVQFLGIQTKIRTKKKKNKT